MLFSEGKSWNKGGSWATMSCLWEWGCLWEMRMWYYDFYCLESGVNKRMGMKSGKWSVGTFEVGNIFSLSLILYHFLL